MSTTYKFATLHDFPVFLFVWTDFSSQVVSLCFLRCSSCCVAFLDAMVTRVEQQQLFLVPLTPHLRSSSGHFAPPVLKHTLCCEHPVLFTPCAVHTLC